MVKLLPSKILCGTRCTSLNKTFTIVCPTKTRYILQGTSWDFVKELIYNIKTEVILLPAPLPLSKSPWLYKVLFITLLIVFFNLPKVFNTTKNTEILLIPWRGNLRKCADSTGFWTKFPHQEIRWNFGILCSVISQLLSSEKYIASCQTFLLKSFWENSNWIPLTSFVRKLHSSIKDFCYGPWRLPATN